MVLTAATVAAAQNPPVRPPTQGPPVAGGAPGAPATPRTPAQVDSLRNKQEKSQLVEWAKGDSILQALIERKDYEITRYQAGDSIRIDSNKRTLYLFGGKAGLSAIGKGTSLVVGDQITYDDSLKRFTVTGCPATLRDPQQNAADIVACRPITYDLVTHRARVGDVCTEMGGGGFGGIGGGALGGADKWKVCAKEAAFENDTAKAQQTLFGVSGSLTSCLDTPPHYRFAFGETKFISKNIVVARPAVLYIADIPILWLPFVVQDARTGRRSGLLSPRIGVAELLRNSPTYRRRVEDLGYYFAISDYMDAQVSLDWRSGARPSAGDPGWMRYAASLNYKWLDRFLNGRLQVSHQRLGDDSRNTALSLTHSQSFSKSRSLVANINYVTNTSVQRRTEFNPTRALATVDSRLNYSHAIGPLSINAGGSRRQYSGLAQVDMTWPTLNVSSRTIEITPGLSWTPSFSLTRSTRSSVPATGPLSYRYLTGAGGTVDSVQLHHDDVNSSLSLSSPFKIGGFNLQASVRASDRANNFPQSFTITDVRDTSIKSVRVYERTFRTDADFDFSFALPSLGGPFHPTPQISFVNVDPSPFFIRNERTAGQFIHQSKRLQYGVSVSPTVYGLFRGFGPVARFRHKINAAISYSYSPKADVSDDFLAALGRTRAGYLGSLAQNQVSLSLSQTLEARLRTRNDSTGEKDPPREIISMNFQALTWDFERARKTKGTGLTTNSFGFTARSALLPGLDFSMGWSLFQGNPLSDSAKFKPYRENVHVSFNLDRHSGIIRPFARLVRLISPSDTALPDLPPAVADSVRRVADSAAYAAGQQVAGSRGIQPRQSPPIEHEWRASVNLTSQRQRPPVGGTVVEVDNSTYCTSRGLVGFALDECVRERSGAIIGDPNANPTALGGVFQRVPPSTSLQGNMTLPLTQNWSAAWQTTYDFVRHDFASHVVTLQRAMHDWDANFAFSQAPNGNFSFSFFVALKAEPDLKFNYDRQSYRRPDGSH
jgi:hypothetical protein